MIGKYEGRSYKMKLRVEMCCIESKQLYVLLGVEQQSLFTVLQTSRSVIFHRKTIGSFCTKRPKFVRRLLCLLPYPFLAFERSFLVKFFCILMSMHFKMYIRLFVPAAG